jgi:hypothetical protein
MGDQQQLLREDDFDSVMMWLGKMTIPNRSLAILVSQPLAGVKAPSPVHQRPRTMKKATD